MKAVINVDGASRGNPGQASCAAIISLESGMTERFGLYLGLATNNVAEYCGLILGLSEAKRLNVDSVEVRSDSNLCVQQILGKYKVKNERLMPLHSKVMSLLNGFKSWDIFHVPRDENTEADAMSNRVLDLRELIDK
jgi:ribonuclease HI